MIETMAERLAVWIKNANEKDTASVEVLKFALIIVINFLIPCTSALVIGAILGKPAETALAILAVVLIRAISGGYHFRSSAVCSIVTAIVMIVPPHIPLPDEWNLYITLFCLVLFAIFAPANMKGYARMPEKYFPLLKIASLLVVGSNLIWQSPILSIIFFIQAISLLVPNKKEVRS